MAKFLPYQTGESMSTQFLYFTEVQTTIDGSENRNPISNELPARLFAFGYYLGDEPTAREEFDLLTGFNEEIIVPVLYEEERINTAVLGNTRTIQGEFHLKQGQDVVIMTSQEDSDTPPEYQLNHITARTDTQIVLRDAIPSEGFPEGASIYPTAKAVRHTVPQMQRYQSNLSIYNIILKETEFEELETEESFDEYEGLPLLDIPPLMFIGSTIIDSYDNATEEINYHLAGPSVYFSEYKHPKKSRQLEFGFRGRSNWNKWKSFLHHCQGRFGEFYIPTYREDFILDKSVVLGNTITLEQGSEYNTNWKKDQHIFVEYDGQMFRTKITAVTYLFPTRRYQLTLETAVPSEVNNATDVKVGLLEHVRLNNDIVEVTYNQGEFRLFTEIITLPADRIEAVTILFEPQSDGEMGAEFGGEANRVAS